MTTIGKKKLFFSIFLFMVFSISPCCTAASKVITLLFCLSLLPYLLRIFFASIEGRDKRRRYEEGTKRV